jgi:3-phenylpropionate/trans-cinnamate dioxygenase ferredoxin reductase component
MLYKYLIIGGGVAGISAAESIKTVDPVGSICVVNNENYSLYSKVMLSKPNYFMEKIPEARAFLKSADWYQQQGITFFGGKVATNLDPNSKTLTLDSGETIQYEKLLLALGNTPRTWPVKGGDKKGIYSLRTFDDYKKIKEATKTSKNAVVVGGGFIGFEMCDILRLLNIPTTLIIREPHFWDPILDPISGRMILDGIAGGGVNILTKSEVMEALGEDSVTSVILNNGNTIPCDLVIVGIGNVCQLDWLKSSGLQINRGILANEYLETNLPDVWTAGDSSEYSDIILEEKVQLGNWVNAQVQGKTAGLNMAGNKTPFKLVSSYNTEGFGINIAFVGDVGIKPDRIIVERDEPAKKSHLRLLIQYGELVGATAINGMEELTTISKLIEKDVKVSGMEQDLANPNFDLKTLLPKA